VAVPSSGPTISLPLVGFAPFHASDAAQLVAPLLCHVSWLDSPAPTLPGEALSITVGGDDPLAAVTVTDRSVEPPGPVQVSANVVVPGRGPTDCCPDVAFDPLQPPDAAQSLAFEALQVRVLLP
jgi:hypothetical protein